MLIELPCPATSAPRRETSAVARGLCISARRMMVEYMRNWQGNVVKNLFLVGLGLRVAGRFDE
jgi:hypothetical protein